MSQNDVTNEHEVKNAPETTVNTEQETAGAEPTVADLHDEPVESKKKVDAVPFNKFIKEKEKRKALEKEIAQLRSQLEGPEDTDSDDDDTDDTVQKLASKLEQLEVEKKVEKKTQIFMEHLNKALENSPEYKSIVNVDVIKQMAFDPKNANKTYKQLLDEAYGNAVSGRRTIETTTPRGGAKDGKVDLERARTDSEYRREIFADPVLKKQYNEGLTDRIFR